MRPQGNATTSELPLADRRRAALPFRSTCEIVETGLCSRHAAASPAMPLPTMDHARTAARRSGGGLGRERPAVRRWPSLSDRSHDLAGVPWRLLLRAEQPLSTIGRPSKPQPAFRGGKRSSQLLNRRRWETDYCRVGPASLRAPAHHWPLGRRPKIVYNFESSGLRGRCPGNKTQVIPLWRIRDESDSIMQNTVFGQASPGVICSQQLFGRTMGSGNPSIPQRRIAWRNRHEQFLKDKADLLKKGPIQVVFIGDTITDGRRGGGSGTWRTAFGEKYKALNLGIGGDRTDHVLCRNAHGELDGIAPKVVIMMIGTNNCGSPAVDMIAGVTADVAAVTPGLQRPPKAFVAEKPRGRPIRRTAPASRSTRSTKCSRSSMAKTT